VLLPRRRLRVYPARPVGAWWPPWLRPASGPPGRARAAG